jgi:hypothetical protein
MAKIDGLTGNPMENHETDAGKFSIIKEKDD